MSSMREAMEAARPEYEAAQARLAEQVKTCRYCKAAKTRAKNRLARFGVRTEENKRAYDVLSSKVDGAMCTEHRNRSRLNFTTSPVSETYWAS